MTTAAVCPDASIVHGLDRFEDARGARAELGNLQGRCDFDGDNLYLTFAVDIRAEGAVGLDVPVTYFVTLIDAAGQIVDKQIVRAVPRIGATGETILREGFEQTVTGVTDPGRWSMLVGFQLPKENALRQRRL